MRDFNVHTEHVEKCRIEEQQIVQERLLLNLQARASLCWTVSSMFLVSLPRECSSGHNNPFNKGDKCLKKGTWLEESAHVSGRHPEKAFVCLARVLPQDCPIVLKTCAVKLRHSALASAAGSLTRTCLTRGKGRFTRPCLLPTPKNLQANLRRSTMFRRIKILAVLK